MYTNTPSSLLFSKDDQDTHTSMKEVTLEDMSSAAKEVDGTGTVDTTNNAAERLKLNQATSTTACEEKQVTVQRKRPGILPASFLSCEFIDEQPHFSSRFIYLSFLFPASSCHSKIGISPHSCVVPSVAILALPKLFIRPVSCYPVRSRPVSCPCLALPCLVSSYPAPRIARAHGNILNLSYAYFYFAYEFKLRGRIIGRVFRQFRVSSCCLLESFGPFRAYRLTNFEVFCSSTVSDYRSRTCCVIRPLRSRTQRMPMKMVSTKLAAE